MNSQQVAYVNGEFLPESQAKISINDRGFIYGDAVFDTARTFNGKIFFLDDHIDRLFESCKYLDINPIFEQTLPERLFDFPFTSMRILPAIEPDISNNLIDIVDDSFDDDWGLVVPRLFEQFAQR